MEVKKLLGKGRTADVFEYEENKILKLFHKNYPKKYVQYEYDVNKYLQEKLSFIPKAYDVIEYQNQHGIIFERIEGVSLLEYLMKNPFRLFNTTKQFAKLHVDIHNCNFMGFEKQKNYLRQEINRGKDLEGRTKELILKQLEDLPTAHMLCHGDFHPDNVILSPKGLIVIDWLTAIEGSPAGDVARSYYILKHGKPTGELSLIYKIIVGIFQAIASRQYLKNYLKQSKFTKKEIKSWELVTITGRLAESIPHEKSYILKRVKKLLKKVS